MTGYAPLAADAAAALKPFREAGSHSFHEFTVDEVRPRYIASCEANGLKPADLYRVEDQTVGEFSVRIYQPKQQQSDTVILFMHGGGWVFGNADTHDGLCRALAAGTGHSLVAVDYRLAPEHPYPAAHDDCRAAFAWLSDSDAGHGLSASQVVLAGDSAGGQLAAMLAQENTPARGNLPIAAQVLLYPITDLRMGSESYSRVTQGYPLVADTMRWFVDLYVPEDTDLTAPALSPLLGDVDAQQAPAIVITVGHDPLADEGIAYAQKLAQAGVTVTHHHLAGYAHGLFSSAGVIAQGEQQVEAVCRFIREHTEER